MGDPLFAHGVDLAVVLIVILKVVVTFVFLLLDRRWIERRRYAAPHDPQRASRESLAEVR